MQFFHRSPTKLNVRRGRVILLLPLAALLTALGSVFPGNGQRASLQAPAPPLVFPTLRLTYLIRRPSRTSGSR